MFSRRSCLLRAALLVSLLAATASPARAQILSSKRGFADSGAGYTDLQAVNAGWYYSWGSTPKNIGNYNASFYPMFWNAPSQSTINNVKALNPTYVLGFNEPEVSTQANMTVSAAISSWDTIYSNFAGTGAKLVSPAVSDTTAGRAWLSSFMATESSKVDAVAFHWYGDSTPDAAKAIGDFEGSVNLYWNTYQKPVFITEFAIHDWGGNYTDQQIIDANQTFLNTVIPWLDSNTHVAGYAWYNWFSDAGLFSGSQDTPTPMSYTYIGALGNNTTTDIGGQNLGEHVADLTGGTLTMTTAGTIKYINALAKNSNITGTIDWGLAGSGNWVRIQPGATLTKSGTNQISFSGGTVTNNGSLEVSQGTLRLGEAVTGNGTVRVRGGTLALTSAGSINTMPLIDVRASGTLDVSALAGGISITNARTLNNNGALTGNVTAATGSTVAGGGTFGGNLLAQSGSVIRVGKDGLGMPSRYVVDDFESYAIGDVKTVASPPWTAHQDTTLADIESYNGSKVLTYGWASDFRGVSRTMPDTATIDNYSTATVFFQINSKTAAPNHSLGLGDQASTSTVDFNDYETQLRLKSDTASTFALDARNGGAFSATLKTGLALNTWYNVWMVVNQTSDTYDLYLNSGTGAATAGNKLNATPLAFRNGTTSDLNQFLALAGAAPIDNGVRIDNLVYQSGVDLTNPTAGFDPGIKWTPETLSINGNYTQTSGAMLQLNISDPQNHDLLHVGGTATLAGTLNMTFAVGAPSAKIGDVYHLMDVASVVGTFSTLQLPTLTSPLAWDSSRLYATGNISIFSGLAGDFTQDGVLSGADVQAMLAALVDLSGFETSHGLSDFSLMTFGDVNHDGQITNADIQSLLDLLAAGGGNVVAVPEPVSGVLCALCFAGLFAVRVNRNRKLRTADRLPHWSAASTAYAAYATAKARRGDDR